MRLIAIVVLLSSLAWAGTFTAASCAYVDVNDCINGSGANTCLPGPATHTAVNGDIIKIPAGTCTWTTTLTVTVNITLIGADATAAISTIGSAGGGQTVLIDNVTKIPCVDAPLILFSNTAQGNVAMSVGNLTIQGQAADTGACSEHLKAVTFSHSVRLHDITYNSMTSTGIIVSSDPQGVADHITFNGDFKLGIDIRHNQYLQVGAFGDNSWAQPDTLGTANEFYVENVQDNVTHQSGAGTFECEYGGRCVLRYSNATYISTHGTDSTQRIRGIRHMEVYNNTLADNGATITEGMQLRAGTILYYNNTIRPTVSGNFATPVTIRTYREADGFTPWGPTPSSNHLAGCSGSSPFDNNQTPPGISGTAGSTSSLDKLIDLTANFPSTLPKTSTTVAYTLQNTTQGWASSISAVPSATEIDTFPSTGGIAHNWTTGDAYVVKLISDCLDQPGRGGNGATLLSGGDCCTTAPTPSGWPNEPLDPAYAFEDQKCAVGGTPPCPFTTVFNGNLGHVLPNKDFYDYNSSFTGASGTGQGLLSARPATCTPSVGYWATDTTTLYQCTSTNTWTVYYQPFTYPHPLVPQGTPAPAGGMFAKR